LPADGMYAATEMVGTSAGPVGSSGYAEPYAARFFQANQNDALLSPREEIKRRQ